MATERKFDIFEVIGKISSNDRNYFDGLQDYEIRQIYPLVLMKWIGGTKNTTQIKLTNDLVNTTVFSLYKHPKLLYKLLMASTVSKNRVSWIKRKSKDKDSETIKLIMNHYECSAERAAMYRKVLTDENILDIASLSGLEKETITKLKKELNG
jgi:uncharacterized protein YbaA (DUF1428 family)